MLTAATPTPRNQLLNALPFEQYQRLQPDLKRVEMPLGKTIYQVGEPINYIYFPENSIFSTVNFFEDGASIETGITGREGMTGISLALANDTSERETSVQTKGFAWQLSADKFREVFDEGGALQHVVLRYVNAYLEQVSQSGACVNHHPVNQRLARWLLMCHDRADGDELQITHDFMAQMLGVNRPSVTGAALELKEEGLINYSRGLVKITDRAGLEGFACECYDSIKQVYDHYLSVVGMRRMTKQLGDLSTKMSSEMRRRDQIQSNTREHMERLQRAVGDVKNLPTRVRICRKCQRVCDFRNNPKKHIEFLGKRMDAEFVAIVCNNCGTL